MSRAISPVSLSAALRALQEQHLLVLAGGTDIYPSLNGAPVRRDILDVSRVAELRRIDQVQVNGQGFIEIGAAVTWSELSGRQHPLLDQPLFDCLAMAAARVGGMQIQNRATVAGNLCHASPAADGVPALMALDAQVVIDGGAGERCLPLNEFITGPRQTALADTELVRAVRVPLPGAQATQSHSAFAKLGQRHYLVISAAMVAVHLDWQDSAVRSAAVAVGACGPVATRLPVLEAQLRGLQADAVCELAVRMSRNARPEHASGEPDPLAGLSPISDCRGSAQYRLTGARVLISRLLDAMAQAPGESMQAWEP